MSWLKNNRFLFMRRSVQTVILFLFVSGNILGWKILQGNYSSAKVFDLITLSDPYAVIQILAGGFIVGANALIGALIILFLYSVLFGRMFCSWVCPMNILSDSALWIHKYFNLESRYIMNKKARYIILLLSLLLSAIMSVPAFESINPVATLARAVIFGFGGSSLIIIAVFLLDLGLTKNGWCGHLCPIGAFYATIGRFSIIKVQHDSLKCTNCKKCFHACPEKQVLTSIGVKSGIISSSECTNCMRCIEICNDNALNLTIRNPLKK